MSIKSNIIHAMKNPAAIQRELARIYYQFKNPAGYNQAGVDVFEEDWDNLILLDTCRADIFAELCDMTGNTTSRISRASATKEFIRANFSYRQLYDIVYVSSNLWYPKLASEINSRIFEFQSVPRPEQNQDYKDVDQARVSPSLVTEIGREINEQYPNKRLILHYSQPHYPYLGETGKKYFSTQNSSNLTEAVSKTDKRVTPEIVTKSYKENLKLALSEVKKLLPSLDGRTVITADHGELLGERLYPLLSRQYGHPVGVYVDELVKVPWHIIDSDSEKEIVEGEQVTIPTYDEHFVDEQLGYLGYRV